MADSKPRRRRREDDDEDLVPRSKRQSESPQSIGRPSILLAFVVAISMSYFFTDTLTFGYKTPNVESRLRQWGLLKELVLTEEELAAFDGTDPEKPIYVAVNGYVFDVSIGRNYYGKDGGYAFFSGKDSARAYVTGCFKTHLTHDLRGLSERQLKEVQGWVDFYKNHDRYTYVGRVVHPPIDPDSPLPKDCKAK